jgi:threonine aldolase
MIRFESDYTQGAYPQILQRLSDINLEQNAGYGEDNFCFDAAQKIKRLCKSPKATVHFFTGGTVANLTMISSALRPHQGVIAASTSHINNHEAGAIEATGHKVLAAHSLDGKIKAKQISGIYEDYLADGPEHCVQPGMVYISQATETGLVYDRKELERINKACKRLNIPLYIDGARLGYALSAQNADLNLSDIAKLSDAFCIGGTKLGALFGEALVIVNPALQKDFRNILKTRGAMLAKGWLLGVQFGVLFEGGLYFEGAKRAVSWAMKLKEAFAKKGFAFQYDSPTNQQFVILDEKTVKKLGKKYTFNIWKKLSDKTYVCRFCLSWASQEAEVLGLIKDIESL